MNILRLSTVSLTLAVAVFALAYADPSFAKGKDCVDGDSRPKCAADPPEEGLTFTINMTGPEVTPAVMPAEFEAGAFEITNQPATAEGGNYLIGDEEFVIFSPADNPNAPPDDLPFDCDTLDTDDEQRACDTWNFFFDVCGIYDINDTGPYGPESFLVKTSRRYEWQVYKSTGGVRLFLATEFFSPIDLDNPLDVTMTFYSECAYSPQDFPDDDFPNGRPLCGPFFPASAEDPPAKFVMDRFSNHARGKKGVAHEQECHAKEGKLLPQSSTLIITAAPPPP